MTTAFITGANRGLGKGFVEYLLDQRVFVLAGMRDTGSIDSELKSKSSYVAIPIDVSDDGAIDAAIGSVLKHVDHIDYLINNAGVNKDSATNNHPEMVDKLSSLDRKMLTKMLDVNASSPIIVTQKFLPLLVSKPSFVINISSGRGSYHDQIPNGSGNYGYRASKAALNILTLCTLFDLPENVKTFAVSPGGVKTDMNPRGDQLPYDQAKKIMLITKNWKEEYSGKFLNYDGSFYPL